MRLAELLLGRRLNAREDKHCVQKTLTADLDSQMRPKPMAENFESAVS